MGQIWLVVIFTGVDRALECRAQFINQGDLLLQLHDVHSAQDGSAVEAPRHQGDGGFDDEVGRSGLRDIARRLVAEGLGTARCMAHPRRNTLA